MQNKADDAMDASFLASFLCEAVMYPTALIPSNYTVKGTSLQWQAVDNKSACATITDGATSASACFYFSADGEVDRVTTQDRYRTLEMRNFHDDSWTGRQPFSNAPARVCII